MCGITGIYSRNDSKDFLNVRVGEMSRAMAHRGPDDEGRAVLSMAGGWSCALGHGRLSILDTSKGGRQPIWTEVAIYVLTEELKKHITVVLSGEGADELFGDCGRIDDRFPGRTRTVKKAF